MCVRFSRARFTIASVLFRTDKHETEMIINEPLTFLMHPCLTWSTLADNATRKKLSLVPSQRSSSLPQMEHLLIMHQYELGYHFKW